MKDKTLQDILPLVENPSRYLGSEINAAKKDLAEIKLRMALAFPDLYEIGSSHFGIQILYHILNEMEHIAAERVFAPGIDLAEHIVKDAIPLMSLETRTPLREFDIIGFSLLYELNYTNVLYMLDLATIPFLASERDQNFPVIIGGGPCTANSEPIADFFDALVIGDGENIIVELAHQWIGWKEEGKGRKNELLRRWSKLEGVYIPQFYTAHYDRHGLQTLRAKSDHTEIDNKKINPKINRAKIADIDQAPFPDRPIVAYGKPIHDRLRLEIARGCTRGCRFCQAGMIYRPVRERRLETLMELADKTLAHTGYGDISLLSLSTGDYGCIAPLMNRLMKKYQRDNVAVSFPSLRAGTLTPELMELIKTVRKTGFTIAPEAGTQRLRDVINKNISEQEIIETVQNAFKLGWRVIKLYFMVGLPTETEADLQGIVDLVKKIRFGSRQKGRATDINVSVATFIPKSHTPFQWITQIELEESKHKISWLREQLRIRGVNVKWQNPEVSVLEGLWARGDRRLAKLLIAAYRRGCRFDGWSDHFRYDVWQEVIAEQEISLPFFSQRMRTVDEALPWDHIDMGVSKSFLADELKRSLRGKTTADCRTDTCQNCGTCDFETISPQVQSPEKDVAVKTKLPDENIGYSRGETKQQSGPAALNRIRIDYRKQGEAKYFGHLELVNIVTRALKRAGISLQYSQGFHPKPKIAFDDPLPIGMESERESFYLSTGSNLPSKLDLQKIQDDLNERLPAGIEIINCKEIKSLPKRTGDVWHRYDISLEQGRFRAKHLAAFENTPTFVIKRPKKKGGLQKIDLKDMVAEISLRDDKNALVIIKSGPGAKIRPAEVLKRVFDFNEEAVRKARVIKKDPEGKNV